MPTKTKIAVQEKAKYHGKTLVNMIEKIAYKYGRHHVWNDLIYMCAAALSQPMNFKQSREDEYLRRINTYGKR